HSLSPCFFLYRPVPHLDLHSFPTRRSSDLFLGERILNVLFIRLPPRALGTDGDETDGRQIIPATFAALAACPFRIAAATRAEPRSEEHTSELQSRFDLVCRLLLEKKKKARP